jgi:hypothetical protein
MNMVKIKECSVLDCAYNKNKQCHTPAITVGGPEPLCDSYITGAQKAGVDNMTGFVGACHVANCQFNKSLECSAGGIAVGIHSAHADCMTFKQK